MVIHTSRGCGGGIKTWIGNNKPSLIITSAVAVLILAALGAALLGYMHFSGLGISVDSFQQLINLTHTVSTAKFLSIVASAIGLTLLPGIAGIIGSCATTGSNQQEAKRTIDLATTSPEIDGETQQEAKRTIDLATTSPEIDGETPLLIVDDVLKEIGDDQQGAKRTIDLATTSPEIDGETLLFNVDAVVKKLGHDYYAHDNAQLNKLEAALDALQKACAHDFSDMEKVYGLL